MYEDKINQIKNILEKVQLPVFHEKMLDFFIREITILESCVQE